MPPRRRISECRRTFIHLSVSLWNDLGDSVSDGVGLSGFQEQGPFYWPSCSFSFYLLLFFLFLLHSLGWYCVAGVFGLIGCLSFYPSLLLPTFFNNSNNNIVNILFFSLGVMGCIFYLKTDRLTLKNFSPNFNRCGQGRIWTKSNFSLRKGELHSAIVEFQPNHFKLSYL